MKPYALTLLVATLGWGGCKQEPTYVIVFAPPDAAAKRESGGPGDAGLGAVRAADAAPIGDGGPQAAAECTRSSDCVAEPAGCCGCRGGGAQVALARSRLKAFRAKRGDCKYPTCMPGVSNHPSCDKVAACLDGRCIMSIPTKKR